MRRILGAVLGVLSLCTAAQAQGDYPTRPITLVVPYAAGGPSDVIARLLGQSMSAKWERVIREAGVRPQQ